MVHQNKAPTAYPAVGAFILVARSEDENSCGGDRRLRRKQGAGAGAAVAEDKPRPKGHRPMRAPQLVRRHRSAGTNSPVDCWLARGRVPGEWEREQNVPGVEMFPLHSLTESVGLFFYCYNPESRAGAPSEDENSREGGRRLRRKQGAGAGAAVAEDKPRPKGRRPMRAPQPVGPRRLAYRRAKTVQWTILERKSLHSLIGRKGGCTIPFGAGSCVVQALAFASRGSVANFAPY